MEPGVLVWFPDAAANATWLILLQLEPFYGTCGNLACALSIYQYADFFDLPIGFPDVPCGAFRMETSHLGCKQHRVSKSFFDVNRRDHCLVSM